MSVVVRIKQKKLFKRKLGVSDIVNLTKLSYGYSDDNFRLVKNEFAHITLIYEEEKLARGIELSLEKNDVLLRLNLPTSIREIRKFYEIIGLICQSLKIDSYIRDDVEVSLSENEYFIEDDMQASIGALKTIEENLQKGYERFEIFGVSNPISIGLKEIKEINNDLSKFENFLHRLQVMDVYYATPKVYKVKEKLIGVYAVGVDILSVVPTEPYIVLDQIKDISEWFVVLDDGKMVKYNDFIANIKKKDYYDVNHVIVKMSEKEKDKLIDNYLVEEK